MTRDLSTVKECILVATCFMLFLCFSILGYEFFKAWWPATKAFFRPQTAKKSISFSQRPSFDGPTVFSGAIFDGGAGVAICGLEGKVWPARKTPAGFACYLEDRDKPLSDKQKIWLLRQEAHKRGIRWKVLCTGLFADTFGNRELRFIGWAVQPGDDFAVYLEDGAKPDWTVNASTQAETAYLLYWAIQQPPNTQPQHRKVKKPEDCPPELHGD